ncbi:MAG: tetratricopeptide repeat protein [Chloroflexi bacterium]|nr:tetratricopeptide repeat protein [Chloroflexota bacterium]
MSSNNNDPYYQKIGDGWAQASRGEYSAAISTFNDIIRSDNTNIDGYYGLGMAQRASGDKAGAKASFEKAKTLSEQMLAEIRHGATSNDLTTTRDDRYMMLIRMLQQRLAET